MMLSLKVFSSFEDLSGCEELSKDLGGIAGQFRADSATKAFYPSLARLKVPLHDSPAFLSEE